MSQYELALQEVHVLKLSSQIVELLRRDGVTTSTTFISRLTH